MHLSFRWYGPDDPVPLDHIRHIPGMQHVVSALYDVPVGTAWPQDRVNQLRDQVAAADLKLSVIESIPVHEDVKLGREGRNRAIDAFCQSLERVGNAGVEVVCYNFMPVVDWTRTTTDAPLPDGSTTLAYDHEALDDFDSIEELSDLPGWLAAYEPEELRALMSAYDNVGPDELWANLEYFLERVVPVAETAGVHLAIHPDDPPWPVFGLPRIVTSGDALERLTRLVDSPANGVTLCTGSLGADPDQDLPAIARRLGDRVHFVHARNVAVTGPKQFHETAHPDGDVDFRAFLRALKDVGFDGPLRPDHGRMIWGETGRPGYGLYDRALGASYLQGLWDAL
jgi:mannonate dehydratase